MTRSPRPAALAQLATLGWLPIDRGFDVMADELNRLVDRVLKPVREEGSGGLTALPPSDEPSSGPGHSVRVARLALVDEVGA